MHLAVTLGKEMFQLEQEEFTTCCSLLVEGFADREQERAEKDDDEQSFSG